MLCATNAFGGSAAAFTPNVVLAALPDQSDALDCKEAAVMSQQEFYARFGQGGLSDVQPDYCLIGSVDSRGNQILVPWNTVKPIVLCPAGDLFGFSNDKWQKIKAYADAGQYKCQPSAVTVAPCPSGSAPLVSVSSANAVVRYPAYFDSMTVQDVLVCIGLVIVFVIGFRTGRAKR